jgi:hypothetical protein
MLRAKQEHEKALQQIITFVSALTASGEGLPFEHPGWGWAAAL